MKMTTIILSAIILLTGCAKQEATKKVEECTYCNHPTNFTTLMYARTVAKYRDKKYPNALDILPLKSFSYEKIEGNSILVVTDSADQIFLVDPECKARDSFLNLEGFSIPNSFSEEELSTAGIMETAEFKSNMRVMLSYTKKQPLTTDPRHNALH
jgi:hypothetical protein